MNFIQRIKRNKLAYYEAGNNWSSDIYSQTVIWRNWALLFALLSLIITMVTIIAFAKLFPLKENTPFLVFVDSQKGEPVTIKPVASDDVIENVELKKYMIRKFIIARERYYPNTFDDDGLTVVSLANPPVYQEYRSYLSKNNPMSPVNLYQNGTLDVVNMNILFLNEQRAYVSFNLILNQDGIIKEIPMNADIKFHFTQREFTTDEAQMINPVNFEVLSYQSHYQVE